VYFDTYDPGVGFYDELFAAPHQPRPQAIPLVDRIHSLGVEEVKQRQDAAQAAFSRMGITFGVYSDAQGSDRIFPFDVIPRILSAAEWQHLEAGLKQRIYALNLFIDDIYHDQKILEDGVIPREIIASAQGFLPACVGLTPPDHIWCHITGTDLVRDRDGCWYVLEDNLRCPSGISYVLENRRVMKSIFPTLFQTLGIQPVDEYPSHLLETLLQLMPPHLTDPTVVVLTPGIYNSAYFEHAFLAQQMGVELVEGRDLVVADGYLQMRTTRGLRRVDVVYRRIDDTFLDPQVFNPNSLLGVPGLMEVYRSGRLGVANAPGTGIADDKVIYAYVPQMIKYYLGEAPVLANVPTYICSDPPQLDYVLAHLDQLVVKAANESGGYGMLMGPQSTPEQRQEFAQRLQAHPRNYIAQPTLCLSRVPTLIPDPLGGYTLEGCHVDLRPYVLYGNDIYVHPGGLTRVALKRGSLVVNSSQGGGSKDTWVLCEDPPC
jgi:uncharacterized circularly permuted ATP-grasp superfamily protein